MSDETRPDSDSFPAGEDFDAQREARYQAESEAGADTFVAFLKDNLEAIAVAVIMALVIKHFCVEAFKIPTSSMRPTLMGETDNERGVGDRILVDKAAYLFGSPKRWDVIVFRYPLNKARNFIKRIAGLPGEILRISEEGDLWVRLSGDGHSDEAFQIPQKPRAVREQFYRAVYPLEEAKDEEERKALAATLSQIWRVEGSNPNGWRIEDGAHFAFAGGAQAELRTGRDILKTSRPDSWGYHGNAGTMVRDVRFQARLTIPAVPPRAVPPRSGPPGTEADDERASATTGPTRFSFSWNPDGTYLAVLALSSEPGESRAFIRRGLKTVEERALPIVLKPGAEHLVEMEYVDGMLRARIDDEELAVLPDGRLYADTLTRAGEQRFFMKAEGLALAVKDLRIDRDLRYGSTWESNPSSGEGGVDIPAKSYFMLGDNTDNSSDSRRWRMTTVHLTGGRTIQHEFGESRRLHEDETPEGVSMKRVVDADGILRRWREDEEDSDLGSETHAAPFVQRDLIVGRAFLKFWPCWPDFPGRLGFIH